MKMRMHRQKQPSQGNQVCKKTRGKIMAIDQVELGKGIEDWQSPFVKHLKDGWLPKNEAEAKRLQLGAARYRHVSGQLYRAGVLQPILHYISTAEGEDMVKEIHHGYDHLFLFLSGEGEEELHLPVLLGSPDDLLATIDWPKASLGAVTVRAYSIVHTEEYTRWFLRWFGGDYGSRVAMELGFFWLA